MKCSLGISNFLEEFSSLFQSVLFLYFSALIAEEGFLISSCYSLELCIQMGISFLFSLAFPFSSFHSYLSGFLKQPFCFFAFIFLGSWRRVLIKYDPLEEGMANHSSITAMKIPWTVCESKKIWHQKMSPPRSEGVQNATGEEQRAITNSSILHRNLDC